MRRIDFFCLVFLLASCATAALADRVVLENGNVLEGRAERRGDEVVVRSALGTLVLSADSVRRIERQTSGEAELLEQLKRAETVEQLLALAERCRVAGAGTLARRALERVLAIDPEHALARERLGYRRRAESESWTLEPVAPTAKPRAMSRAERNLVAALLASAAPPQAPTRRPDVVIVPPLAWPPLGVFGGAPAVPPQGRPQSAAPPAPSVAPPPTPRLNARRATRGRFVANP